MKTRKRFQKPPVQKTRKPNVNPQDQAMYDQTMLAARRVLYGDPNDDTRFRMVLQRLSGAQGQLGSTIGQITAVVLSNIAGAAQKQGKQVPGYILFHAGQEIIADLIEIAIAGKFMTRAQSGAVMQQAVLEGMKTYKQAQSIMQQPAQPSPTPPNAPPQQPPAPMQPGLVNAARGA